MKEPGDHENASAASFRATELDLSHAIPVDVDDALAFVRRREERQRWAVKIGAMVFGGGALGVFAGIKLDAFVDHPFLLLLVVLFSSVPWVGVPAAMVVGSLQDSRALLDLSIDPRHIKSLRRLHEKARSRSARRNWFKLGLHSANDVLEEARRLLALQNEMQHTRRAFSQPTTEPSREGSALETTPLDQRTS